ncbi:MAG: DUF4350 domain-containing protein [Leptolyngbya sp. DLM2.Bin15]|nr:MAG: DUF4350 domain-containing protein [Leptolyngbya sp. DLM2.Bin15]
MSNRKRPWILGALAIAALLLLTLGLAPGGSNLQGSTYNRTPFGYGAWYAQMRQDCSLDIRRWQRSLDDLPGFYRQAREQPPQAITLLRFYGEFVQPWALQRSTPEDWVNRGNVIIHVGVRSPVTRAPFRSQVDTSVGPVQVETRRRMDLDDLEEPQEDVGPVEQVSMTLPSATDDEAIADEYGTVVWQEAVGAGRVIYVVPPFLAANAYQTTLQNFAYLTQLVTEPGLPILVDESLHGYSEAADQEAIADPEEACPPRPELEGFTVEELPPLPPPPTLWGYLAKTPLLIVATQAIALLVLLLWDQNRRFGPPQIIPPVTVDNSQAYINALAGVLMKAGCQPFMVNLILQAERRRLQTFLGLHDHDLSPEAIAQAWSQQTHHPPDDVVALLTPKQSMSQQDLLLWLRTIQRVRQQSTPT